MVSLGSFMMNHFNKNSPFINSWGTGNERCEVVAEFVATSQTIPQAICHLSWVFLGWLMFLVLMKDNVSGPTPVNTSMNVLIALVLILLPAVLTH